eukprot:CCRYP_014715-RA/>CCRYP_014715-RA protein AED:0.01 eAED:0.01 QI:22/1/1/1/1/1/3/4001/752
MNMGSSKEMETEEELRNEITRLKQQLASLNSAVSPSSTEGIKDGDHRSTGSVCIVNAPPEKSGYLFKWQDRAIGWGGTKWGLRFVRLDHGQLSYYKTHEDRSARYVLTLKNCAVRDEGSKVNKRHASSKKRGNVETSRLPGAESETEGHEVGSHFYVFSVYRRPNTYEVEANARSGEDDAQHDSEEHIIPLLRFSTQSYAEKLQWIDLISQSCAYCDSEDFALYQQQQQEMLKQQQRQQPKGTLPALVFEAPPPKQDIQGYPSGCNLLNSRAKHFRRKSNMKDAARSNKISYPPSKPMHRQSNPSYLSEGAHAQNYHGLFNLFLLILVLSNFRLLMHAVSQHGFFFDKIPSFHDFSEAPLDFPFVSGLLVVQAFVLGAYAIEKIMVLGLVGGRVGLFLHAINCNASLGVVISIVWYLIDQPIIGAVLILQATITWLKLISYAHANYDYRTSPESYGLTRTLVKDLDEAGTRLSYPQNITLGNIYYFWFAPTLTYQMAFPRAPFIQWPKVLRLSVQLFVSIILVLFFFAQIVAPNLDSLVRDLENNRGEVRVHVIGDYLLRMSIASTYIWLLGFFGFFHCFMNITAELLRFGDRVFYRDWWNASEVSAYWRLWNMPVHYWLVRHVYFPCIRIGLSKKGATFVVFLLSAVLHEVLISVPCHMIRVWSFLAMMGQIPLIILTKKIDRRMPGSSIGNIIFWISFCLVGQPMAMLLYTIDYWETHSVLTPEAMTDFVSRRGLPFAAIGRFFGASPEL